MILNLNHDLVALEGTFMNTLEKLKIYIDNNLEEPPLYSSLSLECDMALPKRKKISIKEFVEKIKEEQTFTSLLFSYIDKKGLKDSDVYHKANIDRRLFSKIRSDNFYHPKKETVIALGLALELTIQEFENLLESASYSLPKNNVFDLIIRFCVIEKIYDLIEVNALLSEYQIPLIGSEF